ncbi:MAG: metallophosphoesterase family protein [Magnetococcales bacterium]|nr:metallophosphoesterase family protein [Magnetococcales bacterium]
MRIALISDIHGNLPALRAVLQALPQVDLLLCAGDLVGYYPDVNEVCVAVRQSGAWTVRGNHDAYLLDLLPSDPDRRVAYRTDWSRAVLAEEQLSWLRALPSERIFCCGAWTIQLRHASPWDETTYLYPDATALLARIDLPENGILVVGHTHHPMVKRCGRGWLINPGSVGQPRDYCPEASFAVVDLAEDCRVELHRVPYEVQAMQARLRHLGWAEEMVAILSRTRASEAIG